jgi:hypothetical protein
VLVKAGSAPTYLRKGFSGAGGLWFGRFRQQALRGLLLQNNLVRLQKVGDATLTLRVEASRIAKVITLADDGK